MLDDPVTAQYTHTLTVTRRLTALYTCTVANNKPSSDSAQYYAHGRFCTVTYVDIHVSVKTASYITWLFNGHCTMDMQCCGSAIPTFHYVVPHIFLAKIQTSSKCALLHSST